MKLTLAPLEDAVRATASGPAAASVVVDVNLIVAELDVGEVNVGSGTVLLKFACKRRTILLEL